jgi:hypothetical protein
MDEMQFRIVYEAVFDFIVKDTDADRDLFEKELKQFI